MWWHKILMYFGLDQMWWHKILSYFGRVVSDSVDLPALTTEDLISKDHFSLPKELLPRIPNDVTLDHIVTKLPWRVIPKLCTVSRTWRQAIQTQQVYNTRVRLHSTETLVAICHNGCSAISLYSMREKAYFKPPPIPHLQRGFPLFPKFVAMDGKIYILGGAWLDFDARIIVNQNVYVLDMTRDCGWKKCARMQERRKVFQCGVLHGKIYIFEHLKDERRDHRGFSTSSSEVYDPEKNEWRLISSPIFPGKINSIKVVGDEFFLQFYCQRFWHVYHPLKNEWRVVEPFRASTPDRITDNMFLVEGKLHRMSIFHIHAYDISTNSWRKVHSNSWDGVEPDELLAEFILHVNDELLARVSFIQRNGTSGQPLRRMCLIQSRGFGSQMEKIRWETVPHPAVGDDEWYPSFISRLMSYPVLSHH